MKIFPALLVSSFVSVARAGHVLVQSCDLYEGHPPTGGTTSIVEYHWERTTAAERLRYTDRAKEHVKRYAQGNHRCDATRLERMAAVRLVVDAVVTCGCPGPGGNSNGTSCSTREFEDDAAREAATLRGLARTTRAFIGDSRMSGEARTYLHLLVSRCPEPLVFGAGADDLAGQKRRADFVALCEPLNSSVVYVRENTLPAAPWSKVEGVLAQNGTKERWLQRSTQVILGAFVWDIIDKRHVSHFYSTSATAQLGQSVASVRQATHGADVIVRTSPPVNHDLAMKQLDRSFDGNLALVRDLHDAWVTSEMLLASHTRAVVLPAAKIIGEYQAALEIALQARVPIGALYVDTWHPCVPLVTEQWVHLLPFLPKRGAKSTLA